MRIRRSPSGTEAVPDPGRRDSGASRPRLGPLRVGLGGLAYGILALILNPVSRLTVEGSGVLPLAGTRVSWAVLLLVLPAVILVAVAGAVLAPKRPPGTGRDEARGPAAPLRRVALAGLPLWLFWNYWNGLRLHSRGLTYACGVLLAAGIAVVLWEPFRSSGPGRYRTRIIIRAAVVLGLGLEAFLVPISVRLAARGRYEGILRYHYLQPVLRLLLAPDLSSAGLGSRGTWASGLGHGLGGPEGANLQLIRAAGVIAPGSNFRLARLGGSIWDRANIEGSDFAWADLAQADLHHVRAARADFSRTFMVGTTAIGASDFRGARFRHAFLDYSKWNGVDARDSDWTGVNFHKLAGYMCGSDFRGAIFREANLAGLVLMESNFSGADFRGASLRDASVWHSSFHDTDFEGADLRGTDAEVDQLGRARTLYCALLDPALAEAIQKKYPKLFESPDDRLLRRRP